MKIKSLLLIMLTVCLMVCLCACGDDTTPADNNTTTTQNGGNSTTTTTTTQALTTTTTTMAEGKVIYTITVTDEAGNPIPGTWVQMCLESCMPVMTNEQGVAKFENMDEANYDVKFLTVPTGYILPVDANGDLIVYHFEEGSNELTLVLKAAV